jgi:hypothetical protein
MARSPVGIEQETVERGRRPSRPLADVFGNVPAQLARRSRSAPTVAVPQVELGRGSGEGCETIARIEEIGVVAFDTPEVLAARVADASRVQDGERRRRARPGLREHARRVARRSPVHAVPSPRRESIAVAAFPRSRGVRNQWSRRNYPALAFASMV